MPKVVVYVNAKDWRLLEEKGVEPASWVRDLVQSVLAKRRVGDGGS